MASETLEILMRHYDASEWLEAPTTMEDRESHSPG